MSPPAPSEAAPPPLPGPDDYVSDGCPPGVDPTTCCVCSDHTEFEDPSHPHYHKFNDRELADELLEYLIEKERALDAERAALDAADEDDEDDIDAALDAASADDEDDADVERVVRPLPARAALAPPRSPSLKGLESPESPTLAEMAFGPPPPRLRSTDKFTIRPAPADVDAEFDGRGRLMLGDLVGGGSRFAQHRQRQEDSVVAGLASLTVDDFDDDPYNDSFHLASTNQSKKRKIPSPFVGDHSPTGRASPSLQLPSDGPAAAGSTTMSSYLFPSFPALPVGYTRQNPPLPYALRTRLVLARVSPPCRANIWAKAIWAERRLIVGRSGGPCLADEEAWAVEHAGVGWGKGPLSEAVDATHPKLRKEDSRRAQRGGMRGVQQKLSKDGLSLYAVVREEADWTTAKKTSARKPIERLESFEFTFKSDSDASATSARITRVLSVLRERLSHGPPSIAADQLPMANLSLSGPKSSVPPTLNIPGASVRGPGMPRTAAAAAPPKKEKAVCVRRAADAKKKKGGDASKVAKGGGDEAAPSNLAPAERISDHPTIKLGAPPSRFQTAPKIERASSDTSSRSGSAGGADKPRVAATISLAPPPPPPSGGGKKKTGKKKRGALANAGNPHHMKNYIPTRLVSDQPNQAFSPHSYMASLFFPPPTRLLSAAPPKYKAAAAAAASAGEDAPAPGSDEYLCVFCEHTLLYGNSASRRRKLVSKRKKMLARKQRARERASGVANGTKTFAAGNGGPSKHIRKIDQDDEDDDYDGDDWECDDEILPNGQCRRCAERRAHELDRKHKKNKKKKKTPEQGDSANVTDPVGDVQASS